MNKTTKGAIAGTLVMLMAGSSVFAAATSTSTTTIKSTTVNGVTTTTTTTTTKTTETTTTTASTTKKDTDKKNNKTSYNCTKKDHSKCDHKKAVTKDNDKKSYGNNDAKNDRYYKHNVYKQPEKVANCPHTHQCTNSKTCEQLKAKSAKLTCNGKPNCQMHAGTYYENKYHKVTESKRNYNWKEDYDVVPKTTAVEDKPMKRLPSNKTKKA